MEIKETNDNVVFTPEQFIKQVDKARMGEIILWDDGNIDDMLYPLK